MDSSTGKPGPPWPGGRSGKGVVQQPAKRSHKLNKLSWVIGLDWIGRGLRRWPCNCWQELGILRFTWIHLKSIREALMRDKGSAFSPGSFGNLSSCQKTCLAPNRIKFNYKSDDGRRPLKVERAKPVDETLSQFFADSPQLKMEIDSTMWNTFRAQQQTGCKLTWPGSAKMCENIFDSLKI